jgi:hypothetical protein
MINQESLGSRAPPREVIAALNVYRPGLEYQLQLTFYNKESRMSYVIEKGTDQKHLSRSAWFMIVFVAQIGGFAKPDGRPETYSKEESKRLCTVLYKAAHEIQESYEVEAEDCHFFDDDLFFRNLVKLSQVELIDDFLRFIQGNAFEVRDEKVEPSSRRMSSNGFMFLGIPGVDICECFGRHISELERFGKGKDLYGHETEGWFLAETRRQLGAYDEKTEATYREAKEALSGQGYGDPVDWLVARHGGDETMQLVLGHEAFIRVGSVRLCRECILLGHGQFIKIEQSSSANA